MRFFKLLLPIFFIFPFLSLGQMDACMEVGTNFHFFGAGIFKDLKLSSSHFYTRNFEYLDDGNDWDSGLATTMEQDEAGYPLEIPFPHPVTGADQIVAFTIGGHDLNYETGDYVLLYEGEGEFEFVEWTEATVTSEEPGRIEFEITAVNENGIHIHLNSSTSGNHVRNIRIVQAIYEGDFESNPYLPTFSSKLDFFGPLRFMDWTYTNNQTAITWEERSQPNFHTQALDMSGLSWEHIIALCNHHQKDIWINIPHLADPSYMEEMATLFREELDESLTIYLEYSNECWNWIFEQTHWLEETLPYPGEIGRNYGHYSLELFSIWDAVFESDADRIQTVLAGHDYFVLDALDYFEEEESLDLVDLVSYPGYVSLNEDDYDILDDLGASANGDDVMDLLEANIADSYYWMRQFKELCSDPYDKDFVMYEGGQHLTPRYFGLEAPYNPALYEAQTSERMGDFYTQMLDYYKDSLEVTLFMNYVLASPQETAFGSWGLIDNYFVEAPYPVKWTTMETWIAENPCSDNSNITEDEISSSQIILYPNPGQGEVNLLGVDQKAIIEVYTQSGEKVATHKANNTLDLTHLSPGIYWIRIVSEGRLETKKLILQ